MFASQRVDVFALALVFEGRYSFFMARPSQILKIEDKIFGDYCVGRYPTIKALAGAYNVNPVTLKRHMARKGWVERRAELQRHVATQPQTAVATIETQVLEGERPVTDALAARRIKERDDQNKRIEDALGKHLEGVVKSYETEAEKMSLPAKVATLEGMARLRTAVFGDGDRSSSHNRHVAILIGFAPS